VDLKFPEFSETEADDLVVGDLRDQRFCFDEVVLMVTIDRLVGLVADIAGKRIGKRHIPGPPSACAGRNSDNRRVKEKLGWEPTQHWAGLEPTYGWIETLIMRNST
jgi:hypothetical protein